MAVETIKISGGGARIGERTGHPLCRVREGSPGIQESTGNPEVNGEQGFRLAPLFHSWFRHRLQLQSCHHEGDINKPQGVPIGENL